MKKLLIVDDSPLARQVLRASVSTCLGPCDFVEAKDGGEALRLLSSEAFDVVVCDINMPIADGHAVLCRMKAMPLNAKTPVIIVSTVMNDTLGAQLVAAGADVVLRKPFTIPQFAEGFRRLGVAP